MKRCFIAYLFDNDIAARRKLFPAPLVRQCGRRTSAPLRSTFATNADNLHGAVRILPANFLIPDQAPNINLTGIDMQTAQKHKAASGRVMTASHIARVKTSRFSPYALAGLFGLLLAAGCLPVMSALLSASDASKRAYTGAVADWPLFFIRHLFGAVCFDTHGCEVLYAGFDHGADKDTPSASSFSPERRRALMVASYGDLPNFPAPARLRWRSKDRSEHTTVIDFAEIFRDGLIRHAVAREDIAEGVSMGFTHVLLEIDDRTVNVYSRTMIPTKREQTPGNRHSFFRDDLIKVYSQTYCPPEDQPK
jgi:hypothetical protein